MSSSAQIALPGIDARLTVSPLAMVPGDPTVRLSGTSFARATITPDGPGVIQASWRDGIASITTHGDGSRWLTDRAQALLGVSDDASTFTPSDAVVSRLWTRFRGDRVTRTGTLWHDIAWTIVQQRVHRRDAASQWRRFVEGMGKPVDGANGLLAPPEPKLVARTHPTELRRYGIDAHRSQALINVAVVATRLQSFVDGPVEEARKPLMSVPGVGPWTISCLRAFTWGDPDAVIVGDSGIPSLLSSTLAGERRATDQRMLELLEPYRPHRYRILKLAFAARTQRGGH